MTKPISTGQIPTAITIFRAIILAVSLFYLVDSLRMHFAMDTFGGMWRFLTIWTFTANVIVAAVMLLQSFAPGRLNWHSFVTVTMALNFNVLVSYWGLYLMDPSLVQGDAQLPLYRQLYLHVLMILIQWFDAFAFHRVWVKARRVIGWFFAVFIGYTLWLELALKPINGGFPYPFLNDMDFVPGRLMFYGGSMFVGALFLGIAWLISRGTNRFSPGWPAQKAG